MQPCARFHLWMFFLALIMRVGADAAPQECSRTDDRGRKLCQFTHTLFRGDLDGKANMSQDWMAADSRYLEGRHAGIDFATQGQSNKPFYTVVGGTVVYRENGGGPRRGANSVITVFVTNTQSGRPELHKYGHGSSLAVYPREYAYPGQQLGITDQVGQSATGIHVHYEVSDTRYFYNNSWYDLTVNDALNYRSIEPQGRRAVVEQLLRLTVASRTVDPVASVFSLRSQGWGFWIRGVPDYTEVVQGQAATFSLQLYGAKVNAPFRFEALNLPNGYDPQGTDWSIRAASASDFYPVTSVLTIKTSAATTVGTQWITLKATAVDGQERSYSVVLNVKPGAGNSPPSNPKVQALDDVRRAIRGTEVTQIFEQYYYEDLNWSQPYELRWWYAQLSNGNWTVVYHASNKYNRGERYWAYYDGLWNWRGWYRIQ